MFRTEKQRKRLCSDCPMAKVANVIGDPCTLIVVRELLRNPKRFSDLESALAGISSRTLTNKLKELRDNGIVEKKAHKNKLTHTVYTLTRKGRGLKSVAEAMQNYGEKYL